MTLKTDENENEIMSETYIFGGKSEIGIHDFHGIFIFSVG